MVARLLALFPRSSYIVSPIFDWLAFIAAPLIGFVICMLLHFHLLPDPTIQFGEFRGKFWFFTIFIVMTQCHLFITVLRAYGNKTIFSKFKRRLLLGPLAIFLFVYSYEWVFMLTLFVNIWWDVYHSACQTYGFSRLYDVRVGNTSTTMCVLDRILNCLIYIGPILGGANLISHLDVFQQSYFEMLFFSKIPFYAGFYSRTILILVLLFTALFIPYYLYAAWKSSKKNNVSYQKICLLSITALVSILAWGFNTFGMAFLIANFFHAWQYYAMIYWSEKSSVAKRFNLDDKKASFVVIFILIALSAFLIFFVGFKQKTQFIISLLLTISLCHFWFDGFIWSVKKKHV